MSTRLNPYFNFDGNAKEAMEFYQAALGGELKTSTFKEGGMSHDPGDDAKIMHAQLDAPNGMTLMAADLPKGWAPQPGMNVSISLSGDDEAALMGYWDKLSAGGQVGQPLVKASWGDTFGMFVDKFGIRWMVNISGKKA